MGSHVHALSKTPFCNFSPAPTNVYESIEILEFIVWETRAKKVWYFTDIDDTERLNGWSDYLELVDREVVVD